MVDDEKRTPLFERAIRERLSGTTDRVVLDLGTGPFAVFALAAARAGAKKVYAIEAQPEAAQRAREVIKRATDVPQGTIEIVEGFSTRVTLPEKVDLCVAEIIGSIASEEGLHATIRDAQARHMKRPFDPASYIPTRCQTFAAPASYALHYALGPENGFDWSKLNGEPIRLNCRDESLQLLSEPQLLEDISFADINFPQPGRWAPAAGGALSYKVDQARVEANERLFYEELKREKVKEEEAKTLSAGVARSLSGLACWPKLVLDPAGELNVPSRGPHGESEKSHWQTVLPLLSARPVAVQPGDELRIDATVDLGKEPDVPLRYKLSGRLI
jgi:SAM-dependent methyltransferase